MEYANHLKEYAPAWSASQVDEEVARIRKAAEARNHNTEVYKFCYSAIDLTTLSCNDSVKSVTEFARKAAEFYQKYPHIPNVASICIYPSFVETVGLAVDGTPMKITSVGGGFPAAQTFLEVKALEVAMAVENGADEVDIVLNVGRMLTGEYDEAANEVEVIRTEMDDDVVLKVIIESGALKTPELIRKASLLSMLAGADFVKTSTGKIDVAATPEAAVVMCQAIRDYYDKTGRKVGFKAAGGVRTAEDAALYYTIVEEILGKEWLTTELFRIGASSAANNILSAIEGSEVKYFYPARNRLAEICGTVSLGPPRPDARKTAAPYGAAVAYIPIPAYGSESVISTLNESTVPAAGASLAGTPSAGTSSSAGEIRCGGSAAGSTPFNNSSRRTIDWKLSRRMAATTIMTTTATATIIPISFLIIFILLL